MNLDLTPYIGEIARRVLGSPNKDHSTREQLRFGTNGSVAVEIAGQKAGTWYDHEEEVGGNAWQLLTLKGGMLPAAAREWLKSELGLQIDDEPKPKVRSQVVAEYDYVDENRVLLFQVLRYGPNKTFKQRAPDGNGGWTWSVKDARIVPYRLPELVAAPLEATVYIAEGEKDVDAIRARGCIATCNPMGAGKWRPEFAEYFRGRNVVSLPDNDETGREHALDVAANLAPVTAGVRILELPGLPHKGDVSDWLAAGGTREQLEALTAAAPAFDPNTARPRTGNADSGHRDIKVFLGAPYEIADKFLQTCFTVDSTRTLYHYRGLFYEWTGRAYHDVEAENIRSRLYEFLDKRCYHVIEEKRKNVNPSPKLVSAVIDGLRARVYLNTTISAPAWLDGATEEQRKLEPKNIVSCSNGLLYLPTMALLVHTPKFFSHNALEFPYDPAAPAPLVWHEFIGQLWPGDFDACDTLHEMFGYFLTGDTSQQKIFFIIGPRRSGKGTIAKVLRSLLGPRNCTAPTLAGIGETFGLQPLIDKLAAIIGDARLGGKIDQNAIVERLLSISGEDDININRKNASFWNGRLISRLLILSNEIPKLTDASSALVGRFIILRLTESFFGRKDKGLFERLEPELPGILNLAIAGWHRLQQRGHFEQPASSNNVAEQFADISSPIKQFVRVRCELDPSHAASVDALFDAWCAWCKAEGRNHPGTKTTFKNDMSSAFPELQIKNLGQRGEQTPMYPGIRLRETGIMKLMSVWMIDFNDVRFDFNDVL